MFKSTTKFKMRRELTLPERNVLAVANTFRYGKLFFYLNRLIVNLFHFLLSSVQGCRAIL